MVVIYVDFDATTNKNKFSSALYLLYVQYSDDVEPVSRYHVCVQKKLFVVGTAKSERSVCSSTLLLPLTRLLRKPPS